MGDYRSRNTLARSKLPEFVAFCESKGWVHEPDGSPYVVLRMRHPDWREPMIVHQKNDTESMHVTTWGNSADMLRRWMRSRRETKGVVAP
jgi:hypothetical protein